MDDDGPEGGKLSGGIAASQALHRVANDGMFDPRVGPEGARASRIK